LKGHDSDNITVIEIIEKCDNMFDNKCWMLYDRIRNNVFNKIETKKVILEIG
jgi:hypothetical protein